MNDLIGTPAPEFDADIKWVDASGKETASLNLSNFKNKKVVLYGFQSWCPGCHNVGLPTLQKLVALYGTRDDIVFLALQTVFEGFEANTFEKMLEVQKKYNLKIPFGHDVGTEETQDRSSIMYRYHTGGTPWFIILNKEHEIVFSDFHLTTDAIAKYIALPK